MLYEVITDLAYRRCREPEPGGGRRPPGADPENRFEAYSSSSAYFVITSYSIHYTKLYDIAHVRHPIADGLVDGILQGLCAGCHRSYFGAEHFHAEDIRFLAGNVHHAHIHHAFKPE